MNPIENLKEHLDLLLQAENLPSQENPLSRVALNALEDIEDIFSHYSSQITDSVLVQKTLEVLDLYENTPQFQEPQSGEETFFCGIVVHAQQAAYVRKMQLATSSYEVKTGRKLPERTVQDFLSSQIKNRKLEIPSEEVEKRIEKKFHDLHRERQRLLKNIPAAYQALFSDGKHKYPQEVVSSKYFPQTKAWYMGAYALGNDGMLEAMAKIAAQNHIILISDTGLVKPTPANTLVLLEYEKTYESEAAFSQDICDFSPTAVHIPAMHTELNFSPKGNKVIQEFTETLIRNRCDRTPVWTNAPEKILRHLLGNSIINETAKKAIFLAEAANIPIIMNLSYNEGGNTLIGQDKDGPYAIIGQDSFVATKFLLSKNAKREISDEEVRMAFAIDYGIPKERLYFVEQPGDFHLDMKMTIVGERTIILNSSRESYNKMKSFQEGITQEEDEFLKKIYQSKSKLENITEEQLKEAGFTVIRTGGCYDVNEEHPLMNFFNFVTATTPENKKIIVAMGCANRSYKERFRELIQKTEAKDAMIYFLPFEFSEELLRLFAGIGCRIKTLPSANV